MVLFLMTLALPGCSLDRAGNWALRSVGSPTENEVRLNKIADEYAGAFVEGNWDKIWAMHDAWFRKHHPIDDFRTEQAALRGSATYSRAVVKVASNDGEKATVRITLYRDNGRAMAVDAVDTTWYFNDRTSLTNLQWWYPDEG